MVLDSSFSFDSLAKLLDLHYVFANYFGDFLARYDYFLDFAHVSNAKSCVMGSFLKATCHHLLLKRQAIPDQEEMRYFLLEKLSLR